MPYYCTVPRCTSMAGKAKNVSFHQFPRDEELAKLWNRILKRGKPYTKYSKVCSLHFRQEDYTINSVGKKGQWRSLRKDAIPSQNLPSESPPSHQRRSSCGQQAQLPPSLLDPQIQQQFAQAIYVQTMLAMQAASFRDTTENLDLSTGNQDSRSDSESSETPPPLNLTPNGELQNFLNTYSNITIQNDQNKPYKSYKCPDCPKNFKDPDVFLIHRRTHEKNGKKEMLSSNPILANLLRPKVPLNAQESDLSVQMSDSSKLSESSKMSENNSDVSALGIDKIAMALTMEAYVRNLNSFQTEVNVDSLNESGESRLVIDETV